MSTHNHILVREFSSGNHPDHIVVLYRSHLKVVADIKLQLKITSLFCHLENQLILVFIQLDIGNRRKGLKGHYVNVFPVVKHPDGSFRRLDNPQDSCRHHLAVKKRRFIVHR